MIWIRVYFDMKQASTEFSLKSLNIGGVFRTHPTSLIDFFMKMVNGFQPLTIFANDLRYRFSTRF